MRKQVFLPHLTDMLQRCGSSPNRQAQQVCTPEVRFCKVHILKVQCHAKVMAPVLGPSIGRPKTRALSLGQGPGLLKNAKMRGSAHKLNMAPN